MRGNLVAALLILIDALQATPAGAAQFQGAQITINAQGRVQVGGPVTVGAANPDATEAPTGDVLEFIDGSLLHGELTQMDTASGLQWSSPASDKPIDFQPAHVDAIRFAHAGAVNLTPTSHLRFANGDDLFGSVTALDNDHLTFSTWFSGARTIPRNAVQSITMLSSNYSMIYDGPGDADGWIVGNHNPESWTFVDGTFVSQAPGTLGRDFDLHESSTIEFDLAWSEAFELIVDVYSDAVDHMGLGNSYVLTFSQSEVNLRRIDSGRQFPFRTFGSVHLPENPDRNKMRVTIQCNKEEGTVAVFVDDVLVKRWRDENGFGAIGTGLLFQQSGVTGATLKLSNFRISRWRGRFEPETSSLATNVDVIRFINHDQAAGKITGISDGRVTLAFAETNLQIPIQRVTQINFAETPATVAAPGPWEVRAQFPRGGSVSFRLQKWNATEVSGTSPIFGALAFQPGQIRQLEFNVGRPRGSMKTMTEREFEGLDD